MRNLPVLALAILVLLALPATGETPPGLLKELASPAYEGRGVGTEGLARARDRLVNELRDRGFRPAFPVKNREGQQVTTASFTQAFQVFTGNLLGPGNSFGAATSQDDFIPLAFSRSGQLENAELVFAGYGITLRKDEAISYDDYAGLDVRGKIVIVILGDPSIGHRDSAFRNPAYFHYSTLMYKVQNAEQHGAAGIVLVRDAFSLGEEQEPALRFQTRQGGGATSTLLAGQSSLALAARILGSTVRSLQETIARTQAPASFALATRTSLSVDLKRQIGTVDNVAALLPGKNAALADEYLVIGAHYDHLGFGGDSSLDPDGAGRIHPGADDNASGVQGALDLAERIRTAGDNQRPVLLVFFTAEEIGLLGSKQFVDTLPVHAGARVVAMLNLDMVGRLRDNRLNVIASRSGREFDALLERVGPDHGLQLVRSNESLGSSDHASFLKLQIPSLFFTTGAHEDYHRPSDTAEKINFDGLRKIVALAFDLWRAVDTDPVAPTYDPSSEDTQTPPRSDRGYGVYFGSVPEFEQGDAPGVLLSGVRPDSPAERAGLRKGDILTGLGEIEIRNLNDFVFALRYFRPNEEVETRWIREGLTMTAKVTLRARQ